MRKLLFLILLVSTTGFSQAFMEFQFDAKRGTQDAILALTDELWVKLSLNLAESTSNQ